MIEFTFYTHFKYTFHHHLYRIYLPSLTLDHIIYHKATAIITENLCSLLRMYPHNLTSAWCKIFMYLVIKCEACIQLLNDSLSRSVENLKVVMDRSHQATGWMVFPFPKCLDWLCGLSNLLLNGYWNSSPGVKQPGRDADHPPVCLRGIERDNIISTFTSLLS